MKYNTQCFKIYFKYRLCNFFVNVFCLRLLFIIWVFIKLSVFPSFWSCPLWNPKSNLNFSLIVLPKTFRLHWLLTYQHDNYENRTCHCFGIPFIILDFWFGFKWIIDDCYIQYIHQNIMWTQNSQDANRVFF